MQRHPLRCAISLALGIGLALALVTSAGARAADAGDAAAVLTGEVVDLAGAPLGDVTIDVPSAGLRVTTAADGSFRMTGVPRGRATVVAFRAGYEPRIESIDVGEATRVDFRMQQTLFVIPPVVVTTTRGPLDPDRSSLPVETLEGAALRRSQSISIAHAIGDVSGVRVMSTGEQVGKPVIRGLTGPRVLVLDDGSRLEDYSWSDEDGPSIDARLAERVEVVRGPTSLLYGSDALSGVVNAVPRFLPRSLEGQPTRVGFEAGIASNNREMEGVIRAEGASRSVAWQTTLVGRGAGDFRSPTGKLQNTGFGSIAGDASLGLGAGGTNARLRYVHFGGEFKLQEAFGPVPGEEEGPERKSSDDRIQLVGDRAVGSWKLEGRMQAQRHSLIEMADELPTGGGGGGVTGGPKKETEQFNLLLRTLTLDMLARKASGAHRHTLGVLGSAQDNDTRGPVPLVPDASLQGVGLFALEEWSIGRCDLSAGVRGDFRHIDADPNTTLGFDGDSRDESQASGGMGIVTNLDAGWTLSTNVGRSWRAPTLFERYAGGPNLGERRYEIGNPDLNPEAGWNANVGVRFHRTGVRGRIDLFRGAYRNFIYLIPTGATQDSLAVYEYRQGRATVQGGEASLAWEAGSWVTLHGQVEYVQGDNETTDQPLPRIPPYRAKVGSDVLISRAHDLKAGVEVEAVGRQTRLSEFDVSTAPYALVHVRSEVRTRALGLPVTVELEVRNVADMEYRDFMSRYKAFALGPGRNVRVRISSLVW